MRIPARMTALAVCCSFLVWSQQPPATEEMVGASTFRSDIFEIIAPTFVVDKNGQVVSDLRPSDFSLRDNGTEQKLTVSNIDIPISLVVAVQANVGMDKVLPKIRKAGPLLRDLIVGDRGEAAILAFDHRIQTLQEFTNDGTKLNDAMEKLHAGSSSSRLIDAVQSATNMLKSRSGTNRRVILLISETRDNGSESKAMRETLRDAQFKNIAVYAVDVNRLVSTLSAPKQVGAPDRLPPSVRMNGLPGVVAPTPNSADQWFGSNGNSINFIPLLKEVFTSSKDLFIDNPVQLFTKYTGGGEYQFSTQRGLEDAFSKLSADLHSQYLLGYHPNNQDQSGFHQILVTVNRPGLDVRTRPGYWWGGQPKSEQ